MIKKLTILFFCLIFNPLLVSAEVTNFVFTTDAQSIKPNQVSDIITVQAQDSLGKIPQTACIHLETTSATGQFSSNNTNWEPVSNLTMSKNTANKNFYYKDPTPGDYVLTIKFALTTCSTWVSEQWEAEQSIVVSGSNVAETSSQNAQEPVVEAVEAQFSNVTARGESFPVEPQIFASAGPDKIAVVGADEKFIGSSVGLNKEPLLGARYLWSFGDGSTGEGLSVFHNYKYPGEYVVVLDVASGKYSASDRLIVKAVPNQLKISEVNTEFIKLSNGSTGEINISDWLFKFNGNFFRVPETTIIRAKSDLILPNSTTGFKISSRNDLVELLYPNASVVSAYKEPEATNTNLNKQSAVKPKVASTVDVKIPEVSKIEPAQNLASIIYTEPKANSNPNGWLLPTVGIGLLTALGYASIKKQKEKLIAEKLGDDFAIEGEDKF